MKYLIVVYTHEDGVLGAVRAYEQDQLTPEDAVMAQGEALGEIERS
jgi:hypothetical protein